MDTGRLAQEGNFTFHKNKVAQDDCQLGKQGVFVLEDPAVGLGKEVEGRLCAVSSQPHVCDGRRLTTVYRKIIKFACQGRKVGADTSVISFRSVGLR